MGLRQELTLSCKTQENKLLYTTLYLQKVLRLAGESYHTKVGWRGNGKPPGEGNICAEVSTRKQHTPVKLRTAEGLPGRGHSMSQGLEAVTYVECLGESK